MSRFIPKSPEYKWFETIDTINLQADKAELFSQIIGCAPLRNDSAILDVGCSDGRDYFGQLAQTGLRLIGLEYDFELADKCRRRFAGFSNVTIHQGQAEHLDLRNESFDLVVCNDMIYLGHKENIFREIYRVLKPGGMFVCLWNQTIHYYLYRMTHRLRNRSLIHELLRTSALILNTAVYRCLGKRIFFSATFNTKPELVRLAGKVGFTCERSWIYLRTEPPRICLICSKRGA